MKVCKARICVFGAGSDAGAARKIFWVHSNTHNRRPTKDAFEALCEAFEYRYSNEIRVPLLELRYVSHRTRCVLHFTSSSSTLRIPKKNESVYGIIQ